MSSTALGRLCLAVLDDGQARALGRARLCGVSLRVATLPDPFPWLLVQSEPAVVRVKRRGGERVILGPGRYDRALGNTEKPTPAWIDTSAIIAKCRQNDPAIQPRREFAADTVKLTRWKAFLRRSRLAEDAPLFPDLVAARQLGGGAALGRARPPRHLSDHRRASFTIRTTTS